MNRICVRSILLRTQN